MNEEQGTRTKPRLGEQPLAAVLRLVAADHLVGDVLEQTLAAGGDCAYLIDTQRRLLWSNGPTTGGADGAADCHQRLLGRDAPCEACPAREAISTGERRAADLEAHDGTSWTVNSIPLVVDDTVVAVVNVANRGSSSRQSEANALRQMHTALEESEILHRALLEIFPDAITVSDLRGRLLMTNQQAARMHGFDSPEAMIDSDSAFELIVAEDRERAAVNAHKTLTEGAVRGLSYTMSRVDGSTFPAELNASLIKNPDGSPKAFIAVVRDVSDRVQAEQEREHLRSQVYHAQKLESLGVLAGGIAHDFNNLLVGVLGNANLLLDDLPADTPQREMVAEIEAAATRAADLTRQILAFAGKGKGVLNAVDINVQVAEIGRLLRASVSKEITFTYDLAPDLKPVHADVAQLQQVIMNLITNAAEAIGEEHGQVSVRTLLVRANDLPPGPSLVEGRLRRVDHVCLEVTDDGSGMDAEITPKIFDPFFTTKFTGRGLGLASVLGIVHGHQGALQIETDPGVGTSIRVWLPVSSVALDPALAEDRAPDLACSGVALVVDDESAVRQVATQMLTRLGFAVLKADDGEEAVATFTERADEISLVLLDLTMPRMGGAEALRQIRRIKPDVQIILTSGHSETRAQELLVQPGRIEFLQKPYRKTDLAAVVERLLTDQPAE